MGVQAIRCAPAAAIDDVESAIIDRLYADDVQPTLVPPSFTDPSRKTAASRWQRRASPLSRYALLAYALIVIDASLFPFGGWRDVGIGVFDYLSADWPRHALPFDLIVNALGYWPLGFLAGLALHPKVRGLWSVLVATLLCAALSIGLEAVQTYLPARVASKVDVAANVAGGLIGAVCAVRVAHLLLDTGRLRMWRTRWFIGDASRGLVLTLVWFGALIYPDAFVFGMGGLVKVIDPEWTQHLAALAGFANDNDAIGTPYRFELAESVVGALTLTGSGLLFLNLLRENVRWPLRIGLLSLFVAATIAVEVLAHAFLFDDVAPWPLLTQGARAGIAVAVVALLIASVLPSKMRWALGLAALIGALALVNVYPDNPYVSAVGSSWTRGKLMNFYGLASGLNLIWPYFAIVYLLRHRGSSASDARRRQTTRATMPSSL
jgi:VanZ family protein